MQLKIGAKRKGKEKIRVSVLLTEYAIAQRTPLKTNKTVKV